MNEFRNYNDGTSGGTMPISTKKGQLIIENGVI